jgi:hypothetical protein
VKGKRRKKEWVKETKKKGLMEWIESSKVRLPGLSSIHATQWL